MSEKVSFEELVEDCRLEPSINLVNGIVTDIYIKYAGHYAGETPWLVQSGPFSDHPNIRRHTRIKMGEDSWSVRTVQRVVEDAEHKETILDTYKFSEGHLEARHKKIEFNGLVWDSNIGAELDEEIAVKNLYDHFAEIPVIDRCTALNQHVRVQRMGALVFTAFLNDLSPRESKLLRQAKPYHRLLEKLRIGESPKIRRSH